MPVLDIDAIRDILPHRYPFLLVDRIEELESDRIVGIKNITANEPFFAGHFPGFPVMPGVLIVEAMAQVAGVLVLTQIENHKSKQVLLAGVNAAKFRKPVRPGDTIRTEVEVLEKKLTSDRARGVVKFRDRVFNQRGELVFQIDKTALIKCRSPA